MLIKTFCKKIKFKRNKFSSPEMHLKESHTETSYNIINQNVYRYSSKPVFLNREWWLSLSMKIFSVATTQ